MKNYTDAEKEFLEQLQDSDNQFKTTLDFISEWFIFTPAAFQNGDVKNSVSENQGSCQVLALAELLKLSDQQTLHCFGEHYRDVVATPDHDNHYNLRRLVKEGRTRIIFDHFPLVRKSNG